jgi:uncharacterized membrane protein
MSASNPDGVIGLFHSQNKKKQEEPTEVSTRIIFWVYTWRLLLVGLLPIFSQLLQPPDIYRQNSQIP